MHGRCFVVCLLRSVESRDIIDRDPTALARALDPRSIEPALLKQAADGGTQALITI
jgi:hypothetical protein